MSNETARLNGYRKQKNYDAFFTGKGIDIGCGGDILSEKVFENVVQIDPYDLAQGDANYCSNIGDNAYDFVYSSHCLEHMNDPYVTFNNWLRICKPNGYMIHAVPHELFYEKCNWPSRYNGDHKTSWTLEWKSNLPKTIHTPYFLKFFEPQMETVSVETILQNFDFTKFQTDQTLGIGTCQIEFVGKKR